MIFGMLNARGWLAAIVAAALAHAAFFIGYQQPDWTTAWTDQGGYRMLAHGLVTTGEFTRYPGTPSFVPEAIRTPGYPLFVAAVYAIAGESHMAVALVQALVFAALCLMVHAIARRLAPPGVALAASALIAAYPMFPYFGALTLTELWTTFVLTSGMFCCVRAVETGRVPWFAGAGLLIGLTALTRPGFFLLPVFLAVPAALHVYQSRRSPAVAGWVLLGLAFAAVMAPWFAYNYRYFGQLTLSPAGSLGRPVWEGSWQGYWSGRTQAQLTRIAESASDATLDSEVAHFAREHDEAAGPMLEYTRQWRTIRVIWTTPTDPDERVRARILGDEEYLRVGLANISADPAGYVWRRLTRGLFVLWAADVPIRFTQIDATPTWIIRTFWTIQALLVLIALYGAWRLWRLRGAVTALLMVMPLAYVTAVHLPILCEARQSLPVKPLLLILATIGASGVISRRSASS
jgi:4-amino-4-deoxy-L-arabinose transferase-like glycosyltransferase